MAVLLYYTREPMGEVLYDPRLAYSLHLALQNEDGSFEALNHNSGVLFALATENGDGSLNPKSLQAPCLFPMKEGYGVLAVRILGDGGDDEESKGCVLFFTSRDLLEYQEEGLIKLGSEYIEEISCCYDAEKDCYRLMWRDRAGACFGAETQTLAADAQLSGSPAQTADKREASGESGISGGAACGKVRTDGQDAPQAAENTPLDKNTISRGIEGCIPHGTVTIPDAAAQRLRKKLLTPIGVEVALTAREVSAGCEQDLRTALDQCKAAVTYSDGSKAQKSVDWEIPADIDYTKKSVLTVKGTVKRPHFAFPVAFNRADPCVAKWGETYYFIATNDADNNHTLYIREADTIEGLADAEEILLLDSSTYEGIGGLLWAPEFHEVEGRLYIFHAATPGEFFWEESHVMALREGGDPACREDWSAPRRVVRKDGSDICEAGKEITLDMTCFYWEGDYYAVWSQRQFLPKDLGAWLYIAKLDPKEPWKLLTDPVILSKPEYGWANNHTFVDEGPFALIRGDVLYLTFSSAAVDTSYVVGLLTIERGKDLLKKENWKKKNYPILTSRSVEGEYGTGHNAYVIDEEGTVWNTYHARPGTEGVRSSGIRRVHFDFEGEPRLDVTEEADIADALRGVEITAEIVPLIL